MAQKFVGWAKQALTGRRRKSSSSKEDIQDTYSSPSCGRRRAEFIAGMRELHEIGMARRIRLDTLPDEIILLVAKYLDPLDESFISFRLTCHRIYRITVDRSLYRRDHLRISPHQNISPYSLLSVLENSQLLSLDLSGCKDVSDLFLARAVACHKTIKAINVSGCIKLSDVTLCAVGDNLLGLASMNCSWCPLFTCRGLYLMAKSQSQTLTSLDISACMGIRKDPYKIPALASCCLELRTLKIGWPIECFKINPLLDMDLQNFLERCGKLEHLDVRNSHLTNQSMRQLSYNCPQLLSLVTSSCFIHDSGIKHLADKLHDLRYLDISDCCYVTDEGLEYLSRGCRSLRYLNLSRCYEVHNSGVVSIQTGCKHLVTLILAQCFNVSDIGIEMITTFCPNLQILDLTANANITEPVIRKVKKGGKRLQVVTTDCPNINSGEKSRFSSYVDLAMQVHLDKYITRVVLETSV